MSRRFLHISLSSIFMLALVACGQPAATPAPPAAAVTAAPEVAPPTPEAVVTQVPEVVAATAAPEVATTTSEAATAAPEATSSAATTANLGAIKVYLQKYGHEYLAAGAATLKTDADRYYDAVKAANFDYKQAWGDGTTIRPMIMGMREAFNKSHTGYESVEGIVAGVPSLSNFDTILDAGSPGAEGGDNIADFTLKLPDGSELKQPGNFFHSLLEPMIYGTDKEQTKLDGIDVDGDGKVGPGDMLPDANRLKGTADAFVDYVTQTNAAIDGWQPTAQDAFTAMVTMTPTMDEYFSNWKESRYVTGSSTSETRFVAHSRLVDVTQILASIRTIYAGVQPLVHAQDPAAAAQIDKNYADLSAYVQSLLDKEQAGNHFTPDQADVLGKQAQDQAQTIVGQVTQAARQVGITLDA